MHTENQSSKPNPEPKQETGEGCSGATCSASSCECAKCFEYRRYLDWKKRGSKTSTPETDAQARENKYAEGCWGEESCVPSDFAQEVERERNRLRELLEDYVRDKKQIGKDLGLPEDARLHHRFQRRIICDLQRENRMMRMALEKVHERMQGPASNRRFMQIAGPARECLNLAKPFLPNKLL
jgi:hypothetical protein